MTFHCPVCGRNLPDFMQHSGTKCNECVTGKTDKTGSSESTAGSEDQSGSNTTGHTEPEVVDVSSSSADTQEHTDTADSGGSDSEVQSSVSEATTSPSTDSSAQIYQKTTVPQQFTELTPCDVFALGYYDNESWKTDEYSTKIIQYCKNNDTNYKSEILKQLHGFIRLRCDQISPDIITVYPKHNGGVSEGLANLAKQAAKQYSMSYDPLLTRAKQCSEQKNKAKLERWKNQIDSIEVGRTLDDEVVLILDDIVTTGASVTVGKTELCKAGAIDVIAVCLGISKKGYGERRKVLTKRKHSVESVRE